MRLYEDEYYSVESRPGHLFVLRRSAVPLPSVATFERTTAAIVPIVLECVGKDPAYLLVDMRQAPSRNDASFEEAVQRFRLQIREPFRRVAVLVRSKVGKLQLNRLDREQSFDGRDHGVFDDEEAALGFLGIRAAGARSP